MGIAGFNKWMKENYNIESKTASIYHNIMIDFNHILHGNIKSNMSLEEYLNSIRFTVYTIFNNYIATKNIIIAIDGIPPYSKMMLQKIRRNDKKYDINYITPLHITPGTLFMDELKIFLTDLFDEIKTRYMFIKPNIIIDSSDNINEGEIKLLKYLLKTEKEKTLIIGNDADLMILSACCNKISDVDLLLKFGKEKYIININSILQQHAVTVNKFLLPYDKNFRSDFAMISLLMGNDYLPKLRMASFNKLWKYYKQIYNMIKKPMIINDKFNMEFLLLFFKAYSKDHKSIKLKENANLYLQGLLWCITTYQTGKYKNFNYVYKGSNSINSLTVYNYIFDMVLKKHQIDIGEDNNVINIEEYIQIVMPEYVMDGKKIRI